MIRQKAENSKQKILNKIEENKKKEFDIAKYEDKQFKDLNKRINFFKNKPEEVKSKVKTTEYYKGYYEHSHNDLNSMREKYKDYLKLLNDELNFYEAYEICKILDTSDNEEQKQWLSNNIQNLIAKILNENVPLDKDIIEQISDKRMEEENNRQEIWLENKIESHLVQLNTALEGRTTELQKDLKYKINRPIVWGMPNITRSFVGLCDEFIYSSKSEIKTVYIPFTNIHTQLAKSNWIMVNALYKNPGSITKNP